MDIVEIPQQHQFQGPWKGYQFYEDSEEEAFLQRNYISDKRIVQVVLLFFWFILVFECLIKTIATGMVPLFLIHLPGVAVAIVGLMVICFKPAKRLVRAASIMILVGHVCSSWVYDACNGNGHQRDAKSADLDATGVRVHC